MNDYKNLSQTELIKKFNNSDPNAFSEIYNRYHKLVFMRAYLLTNDEKQSKNVVQDVFIRLCISKVKFDPSQSIASYLLHSTKNEFINLVKPNKNLTNHHYTTDDIIREQELDTVIAEAIKNSPDVTRKTIERHVNQYFSHKYTNLSKRSKSNIRTSIKIALKQLRFKHNDDLHPDITNLPLEVQPKQLILPETPRIITEHTLCQPKDPGTH